MSSNGARMDYDFGRKKNWRCWAWNRVVERLPVHPSQALVLYLAGADDYDRRVARRKGFRDHNLIAVERDPKALAKIRANGALCVAGDFFETLYSWPSHTPLHAVIGDLCCGLELSLVEEISTIMEMNGVFDRAALAFNFMRGREATGLANWLKGDLKERAITESIEVSGLSRAQANENMKHRGLQLINYIASLWVHMDEVNTGKELSADEEMLVHHFIFDDFRAQTNSYMSPSGQRFDSVVFAPSFTRIRAPASDINRANVSAILAHRTMRMSR